MKKYIAYFDNGYSRIIESFSYTGALAQAERMASNNHWILVDIKERND